jgi:hypothetical protein
VGRLGEGRTAASHRRAGDRLPDTATPRVVPAWWLVDATEAATPAIETGIPETAEVVIGGLIVPSPIPKSR